jgi:hypothetical protein
MFKTIQNYEKSGNLTIKISLHDHLSCINYIIKLLKCCLKAV